MDCASSPLTRSLTLSDELLKLVGSNGDSFGTEASEALTLPFQALSEYRGKPEADLENSPYFSPCKAAPSRVLRRSGFAPGVRPRPAGRGLATFNLSTSARDLLDTDHVYRREIPHQRFRAHSPSSRCSKHNRICGK